MSHLRRPSGGSLYGGNAASVTRDYSTRPPSGSYGTTYGTSYRDTSYRTSHATSRMPPTGRTNYESKYGTPRYGTSRTTSPGSTVGSYTRKTTGVGSPSPRPLPPGPGPLDENNQRMSLTEINKRVRTDPVTRTGPIRANHGTSSLGTSTLGASSSLRHRTGSVTDLSRGLDNMNLSSTTSLSRSRRYGSHADLSARAGRTTPDKRDSERMDNLFDSGGSQVAPVSRSYFKSGAHTYDYKSSEHDTPPLPPSTLPPLRRRSLSQDPLSTRDDTDSPAVGGSRRTSLVSSRAGSITSPVTTVSDYLENTVWCRYNAVNFLTNIHQRHPIARPLGWGMGCLLWIQHLIDILPQFLLLFM